MLNPVRPMKAGSPQLKWSKAAAVSTLNFLFNKHDSTYYHRQEVYETDEASGSKKLVKTLIWC